MTTLQLDNDQREVLANEVTPLLERAKALTVRNTDDILSAENFVKTLKAFRESIEDRFHPTRNKQTAYKAYEEALETEKAFYTPIDEAVKLVKGTVKRFDTEESLRVQREAQMAEAKRQEEERKKREELEAKAKKAEEKGKIEKAEALREAAENVVVAPSFTPPPVAVKKLVWKARVTNMFMLCRAVADGLVPFSVLEVNQAALNAYAKNHDGKAVVPGLEFTQEANSRVWK